MKKNGIGENMKENGNDFSRINKEIGVDNNMR